MLALALLGVVAAVCVSLGMWQLQRAAERDALHAAIERGRQQPAVVLSAASRPADLIAWRPATAQGRWSVEHTVLLENRNLNGRPGYWVATPLLLEPAGQRAVLVLRGWLPRDMAAAGATPAIPDNAAEGGMIQVQGELLSHVPRIFELWQWAGGRSGGLPAVVPPPNHVTPVVQNLQLAELAQATGLQFLPTVLAQTAESKPLAPAGAQLAAGPAQDRLDTSPPAHAPLQREWPGPSLDSDQNRGYALQWFSFAGIAGIAALFIVRSLLQKRRERHPL